MINLSVKEKVAYNLIFNERRVYSRWYGRFLSFGVDYGRIKRVVSRINSWLVWCREWVIEGDMLYCSAGEALDRGQFAKAKALFHEAVGCYHIGQHIFFIDSAQKEAAQEKARMSYKKAISLYDEHERPVEVRIPFKGVIIKGYLRVSKVPNSPLVIFVNGMDNIKEAEGHFQGNIYSQNGFNFFTFDGPGQGEMRQAVKFDVKEYPQYVSAIIDWFEKTTEYSIDTDKIALAGFSLGGYLAPMCAARDMRVKLTVGNSGLMYVGGIEALKKMNPIWKRGVTYMTDSATLEEAVNHFNWDISNDPNLEIPLLFYHAGRDEVIPNPKTHIKKVEQWAKGEKTIRFYENAEHCTMDYLDEVFPEIIDWLKNKFEMT